MTRIATKIVNINDKKIKIVRLSDISDVKVGLQTGDNKFYVYKAKDSIGPYKIVDEDQIVPLTQIKKIERDDKLRKEIIDNGISKKMFNGKTIVPFDKGGGSDSNGKILSKYCSQPKYFIDWSEKNVTRMKTLTIAERNRIDGSNEFKPHYETTIAAVFRNMEFNFKKGITFPMVGIPTFKLNLISIFDHGGNCLFIKTGLQDFFSTEYVLGVLNSKIITYVLKNYINNTINTEVEDIKKIPIPICNKSQKEEIEKLVEIIIQKQELDKLYPYHLNEQPKIEEIVSDIFCLDSELKSEIDLWFDRKYPHLVLD